MQHITYFISNPVYVESQPPPPFSMLYKKEANSRDRKFNIEKGGGGSIVEIKKEICLKYPKMTKCLNTFVAHCRSTDLKFQKVQKSLVKGIIIIVTEVCKLMGNSGPPNAEDTVGSLMDGVLLLANANQELNYRRRELMRPQLNANYRHFCSPSNPVTSLLFGDDVPKAVKDISDTNRLSPSLPKTAVPLVLQKAVNHAPIQVSFTTRKFAVRLRHFLPAWSSITTDQNILDIVQHCHLEIGNPNQTRPRPEIQFDSNEKEIIDSEITHLLEMGVIELAVHSPGEYISTIFVRKKKSGKYRMILNLKGLNQHIEKHHFKMDTLWSAVRLMTPNCFMASIDLTDAYYVVPIAEEHRKYLRFYWQGCLYQYTCMPNGLSSAPRCFTKLLKPVYSTLRQSGHINVGYIDDSYLQGSDIKECLLNISETQTLFTRLGFVINVEKSCFIPAQQITFLGFVLDSVSMTIALTEDKKAKVKANCKALLPKTNTTITELAQLVGTLVSCLPGVQFGKLHYRNLDIEKNMALRKHKGNYEAQLTLSSTAKDELIWRIENVDKAFNPISHGNPTIELRTDASKKGWGAYLEGDTTQWNL